MTNEQREALLSASTFNVKLIECVKAASENIRGGKIEDGYQSVAVMTEGIEWLIGVITVNSEVLIEKIDVMKLNDIIREMIESIENGDNGLLGDLLEYEILEILTEWQSILKDSL